MTTHAASRALKAVNKEIADDYAAVKGMSPNEKRALVAVVIVVISILGIVGLFVYAKSARADAMTIDARCDGEVCTVKKADMKALIEHNNAVHFPCKQSAEEIWQRLRQTIDGQKMTLPYSEEGAGDWKYQYSVTEHMFIGMHTERHK